MQLNNEYLVNNSNKLIKNATNFSVIAALLIIFIKLIGWYKTDSVTIFAACVDSLLDIVASILNLVAVRYALQPPDEDHRFGYEKVTDLAVLSQSSFFCLSGVVVMIIAIRRFFSPEVMINNDYGIYLMFSTILITLCLVIYQKYVIYKTQSNVISADNIHYVSDLLTNLVAILSLWLSSRYDFLYADPIFGVLIALYIFVGSWKLLKKSFHNLMDKEFNEEDRQRIKDILLNHEKVKGFHDLKTRHAGSKLFIQVHLEMDGNISLYESHEIVHSVEAKILEIMPNADMIIHQDPCGIDEKVLYKD